MQTFQPNDTISNRYKVLRKLGAGAMGSVYLCEDSVEKNIKVALKVLVSADLDDQDVWAKGEYEALTRLRHPNLARVYNFGRIGDTNDYYIVSEFIKGTDLYSATEYLRYDELADIIVQICRALEYIHSQGYVHFDIKPDNILVTRYKTVGLKEGSKVQYNEADLNSSTRGVLTKPHVKLIDFGLAEKITGSFSFAIKGTLNYLAPEIMNGITPDKRADLYSLGVTLYQVSNRDLPFCHDVPGRASGPPPKPRELFEMHMKKHPDYLQALIMKLLEEDVEERFQSAREVIQYINKHSGYHFEAETEETRASYFYASRLVGRRREINLLKDYHERVFFPNQWRKGRRIDAPGDEAAEREAGRTVVEEPAAEEGRPDGARDEPEGEAVAECAWTVEDGVAASDTPPAMVFISGEMGSGKSRLLEEFHHYLRLQDFPYFSGNCYEGNQKAYQPFIEILSQLAYHLGFDSELYKRFRSDVLKLVPDLGDKRDSSDGEGDEDTARLDKERLRFIERLSQLLVDASLQSPFVLAINNLHWVDDASLDLLESISETIEDRLKSGQQVASLILLSVRPEEPLSDRLRDLVEKWKSRSWCREILVRRMKYAQIREFLQAMLSFSDVPDGFVMKLLEQTGGNPLFVVETLKTLEDDGIIRNCGESWVIKTTNFDRIDIPHRMEDILGKRLEKLEPVKLELLEVLSVLDTPANPKFVQKLKRFQEVPILVELRNLEQTGLVAKTFEGGKLHFQIAQPKVREIVYGKIADEKRQRYHGEIGDLYSETFRGRESEILEELAYHYRHSDKPRKAIDMAIRAGDRLKKIYANERAYQFYSYVLEKVEGVDDCFEMWVETQEKLGDLCTSMGKYDEADRSYSFLLKDEVRDRLDTLRVIKIFLARGKVFEIQGDYEFALKCYKDSRSYLSGFDKTEFVVERTRVFNSIGWVYVCMGKYEKAMAISLEALRLLKDVPDTIEHAMLYNTIGSANYFKGNFGDAIDYHRRSLQIKENLENIPEIVTSLNNLGSACIASGEYGEAYEHLQRSFGTCDEIGDPYGKAMTMHNLAKLYFAVGQPDKGWEHLDESLKLSKQHNMRYLNVQNYLVRGKALMDQGDCSKAEGNFFRALTAFSKQGNRWGLCSVLLEFSRFHRMSGNLKEALGTIEEAKRYAKELDIHYLHAFTLIEESRLRRENGAEGLAAACQLLDEARSLAERCGHPELLVESQSEIGDTQIRLREMALAEKHYRIAEEKLREIIEVLPEKLRESYANRQRARFPNLKAMGSSAAAAAPATAVETVEAEAPASARQASGERPSSAPPLSAEESLARVNRLMVQLLSGVDLRGFLEKVLVDLVDLLGADSGYFLSVQSESVLVDAATARSGVAPADPETVLSIPLIAKVLESGKPLLLADRADDPECTLALESQDILCSSLVVASFRIQAELQGVLYLVNPSLPKGGDETTWKAVLPFLNLAPIAYHQLANEATPAVS